MSWFERVFGCKHDWEPIEEPDYEGVERMIKPDEKNLFRALKQESDSGRKHVYVRELVKKLGIPEGRAAYILGKWSDLGYYNYGINVLAGWLEEDKVTELEKRIEER